MEKIKVKLKQQIGNSYDIVIGKNLDLLKLLPKAHQYIVITDSEVKKLYADKLVKKLKQKKITVRSLSFHAGEKNKHRQTKARLEDQMFKLGCGRDTMIIALGGGVTGDLTGFIAATYMRGVPYVQIPTSLLAMVDSSVGGKTAIDTDQGKNLIGAFYQPKKVIIDVNFLDTLPKKHVINGLVEATKMFLTHSKTMFNFVDDNLAKILEKDKLLLQKIIKQAVEIKIGVVERDEKEKSERMVLNFGHTVGHAIEKLSDYKLLHGQAVAVGMLVESKIAEELKILSTDKYNQLNNFIKKFGIHGKIIKRYSVSKILEAIKIDKKNKQGKFRVVLLSDLGKVYKDKGEYAQVIDKNLIKKVLQFYV